MYPKIQEYIDKYKIGVKKSIIMILLFALFVSVISIIWKSYHEIFFVLGFVGVCLVHIQKKYHDYLKIIDNMSDEIKKEIETELSTTMLVSEWNYTVTKNSIFIPNIFAMIKYEDIVLVFERPHLFGKQECGYSCDFYN